MNKRFAGLEKIPYFKYSFLPYPNHLRQSTCDVLSRKLV